MVNVSESCFRATGSRRKENILSLTGRSFSSRGGQHDYWGNEAPTMTAILAGIASASITAKLLFNELGLQINSDTRTEMNSVNNIQMNVIATSAAKAANSKDTRSQHSILFLDKDDKPSEEVDFIIIGHGNAGQSAAKVLAEKCPLASIMVVNPHPVSLSLQNENGKRSIKKLRHITGSAMNFNHSEQTVDILVPSNLVRNDESTSYHSSGDGPMMKRISYKHSILISSGTRGSPPPKSLVDERAVERILEVRSTQLPSLNQYSLKQSFDETGDKHTDSSISDSENSISSSNFIFPSLPKQSVRQISLMAASQGARICILGSGFEAIELAASASIEGSTPSTPTLAADSRGNIQSTNTKNNICLSFGGAAPLGGILPRYLSTAVSKRLKAHGIEICDRTLVRYVSFKGAGRESPSGNVEVHMAKSYDTLETKRYKADLVVVAPSVSGQKGCAAIPTVSLPGNGNISPKISFNPWAKLSPLDARVISCYSDDGRIVVNAELSAASNVYAAGSVAKYPNHNTGHATVAGEGVFDGGLAGKIAAENMATGYYDRKQKDEKSRHISRKTNVYSDSKSLPVIRSDKLSTSTYDSGTNIASGLSTLGIRALCVGQCNSQTMSTHGFFWTNQSRKLTRRRSNAVGGGTNHNGGKRSPVYGQGVVFYLDRAGTIRGVMVWGLPFTKSGIDGDSLNKDLVGRMKKIIHTNGEVIRNDHKVAIEKMRLDPTQLYPSHLAEESMSLAQLTISKSSSKTKRRLPRPLHRYLPSKPISITSIGTLKKSAKIGTGSVGEDIFERDGHDLGFYEGERTRHPSLVHYFTYDWSSIEPTTLDAMNDDEMGLNGEYDEMGPGDRISKNPEYSARPPKEEPLWLRKNETTKMLSLEDKLSEAFMQNIKRGHFSDGSDPVKQAPTPKIISDAREEFNKFVGRDSDE